MKRILLFVCLVLLTGVFISCSCEDDDILIQQAVTVKFDSHIGVDVPLQTVGAGMKISEPTVDLKRDGYTFLGWYNGTKKWNFNKDVVTESITLTAKWKSYLSYVAVSEIESPSVKALFGEELYDGVVVAGCDLQSTEHAVIPEIYNGKRVVGILPFAFANNKNLKTVFVPSSVSVVGEKAFYDSVSLEFVYCKADTLPQGWNENIINNGAELVLGYK